MAQKIIYETALFSFTFMNGDLTGFPALIAACR